jgi:uncharacterized membrane protein HdeD (DUF308 family)
VATREGKWWIGLIAGLINVGLGLFLIVSPRRSLATLAWLAGAGLIVWGIRQLIAVSRLPDRVDRTGGLLMAVMALGLGLAIVVVPEVSLRLLRILVGVAAIVWGLQDSGRPSLSGRSRWWVFIVRGLGSLGLGLALIFVPEPTVALIGVLLGALLLLWGVVEVIAAFVLRPASARSG